MDDNIKGDLVKKRNLLSAICIAASVIICPASVTAQDFPPKRPVTLYVGFAPGGAADAAARLIAKKLTENIGQNVIVENKAGGNGSMPKARMSASFCLRNNSCSLC